MIVQFTITWDIKLGVDQDTAAVVMQEFHNHLTELLIRHLINAGEDYAWDLDVEGNFWDPKETTP